MCVLGLYLLYAKGELTCGWDLAKTKKISNVGEKNGWKEEINRGVI